MSKLSKLRDLYQMGKQAKVLQKELRRTEIEAENSDASVKAVVNGEMHLKSIEIGPQWLNESRKRELEQELVKVISEAISRAQGLSAEKARGMMGDLGINLPGM